MARKNTGEASVQQEPAKGSQAPRCKRQNFFETLFEVSYREIYLLGTKVIRYYLRINAKIEKGYTRAREKTGYSLSRFKERVSRRFRTARHNFNAPFLRVSSTYRKIRFRQDQLGRKHGLSRAWAYMPMFGEVIRLIWVILLRILNYVAPAAATVLLISTINYFTSLNFVLSVEYSGKQIGYILDESVFEKAEKMVQGRIIYEEYRAPEDTIPRYTLTAVDEAVLNDVDELTDKIIEVSGHDITKASGLYVDGEFIGATQSPDLILSYMDEILTRNETGTPGEKIEFVNEIRLLDGLYPSSSIIEPAKFKETLEGEIAGEEYYTVKAGDAPSLVADKVGISYSELLSMNPDIEKSFYVGDKILISRSVPLLKVMTIRREQYEEDVPFGTDSVVDTNRYTGYYSVISSGVLGKDFVTADITYIDGVPVEVNEISRERIKDPVNQRVAVGTANPLQYVTPSGAVAKSSFIWPCAAGRLTCGINGYPGHTGMDIGAPIGTPILASAPGTVVRVQRVYGGYGLYLIIDHGSGWQTLYAHTSKIFVSVGDTVKQGQVIAAVGLTGNTTGAHVHFEIRNNGKYMDPSKYIGTYCPY